METLVPGVDFLATAANRFKSAASSQMFNRLSMSTIYTSMVRCQGLLFVRRFFALFFLARCFEPVSPQYLRLSAFRFSVKHAGLQNLRPFGIFDKIISALFALAT